MRLRTSLLSLAIVAMLPACAADGAGESEEDFGTNTDGVKQCAQGKTVRGVDVSYYQGNIDWNAVHASGVDFAIARASDGAGFKDPKFAQNWNGMREAGLVRGLYQFFRPKQDPIAQADLAIAMMNEAGGLQDGDLPLMLDLEVNDGVSAGTMLARAQKWLDHVQAVTGKAPMIYTGAYFWQQFGAGSFDAYPLVVANWDTSCPSMPKAWSKWTMWQDADDGSVPGIKGAVDTDVFNGSLEDLLAFAGGGGGGKPPADIPAPNAGDCGVMVPGQAIGINESVTSCDGRFTLIQQDDGNLVLYQNGVKALWWTGTDGTDGSVAVMQDDGNFVVYTPGGKALWDAGTWGKPGSWLAVQDDGNLVIYTGTKPIWASNTAGY